MDKFVDDVKERFLDKTESRGWEIIAIVLMLIPVALSLQSFKREFITLTGGRGNQILSIEPTMISVLYAIFLHGILYARGIGKYFESGFSITLNILNVLWTASFISIFISSETFNIPIINQAISSQVLMMIAIVLSLISMRAIAGFIWIFLAFLAVFRLAAINEAMGLWGVTYIICAYCSLGIQIWKLKLLEINKNELMYEFRGASNRVFGDIYNSVNLTKEAKEKIMNAEIIQRLKQDKGAFKEIE